MNRRQWKRWANGVAASILENDLHGGNMIDRVAHDDVASAERAMSEVIEQLRRRRQIEGDPNPRTGR